MGQARSFEWVADALERETDLARLEARGTVRLALKRAGLEARTVTSWQMQVVLRRVLPEELRRRGVEQGNALCERLAAHLPDSETSDANAPEAVFRRLAGEL